MMIPITSLKVGVAVGTDSTRISSISHTSVATFHSAPGKAEQSAAPSVSWEIGISYVDLIIK